MIQIVPCRTIGILDGFCKWATLAFLRTIYVCKTIAYHMIISISAAASGNACESVYNPYVVKDSVCIGDIREFFDLRTVAAGSQDEL